jgi:fucose 4-O-acetylase-like acetyltransferase
MARPARQDWVDIAKGIGILLVVYGHTARGVVAAGMGAEHDGLRLVDSVIYSFHMPLFLFLSGLFFYSSLQKRGALGLVLNRVDTVLYPYVVWSLLQGFIEVMLGPYTNGTVSVTQVLDLAEPRAHFWYLFTLFLLTLVCTVIYLRLQPRFHGLVVAVAAVIFIRQTEMPDIESAHYLYFCLVYFAAGIWFSQYQEFFQDHRRKLLWPVLALFATAQWLFHLVYEMTYKDIGLPLLLLAGVSILAVVLMSGVLSDFAPRWLIYLGASSMTIYLMHILVGSGLRVVLHKFLGVEDVTLHIAAGMALAVLLPLLALELFRRWNLMFLIEAPKPVSGNYWYRKLHGT